MKRECVRNADCDTGNCSSSRCWERNGPFVSCNPSYTNSCANDLVCDTDSYYCVPHNWSSSPDQCNRHADCGRDSWCDASRKKCKPYQIIGEPCNATTLKCGKDAACFGGYCRAKCDVSQGEEGGCSWVYEDAAGYEGNVIDLRCRKVKKYDEFEVCLPKGLALVDDNEPISNDDSITKADDTVTNKTTETESSSGTYWLIGGVALLVLLGLGAFFFYMKTKRVATKKEQKQQRGHVQRPSSLSLHTSQTAPIVVTSAECIKSGDSGLDRA